MAKDPAFLFYYDRFLSGTISMTDSEVGQYVRLMCVQANKGHITKKDMMHICKSYDSDVCLKFKDIGGDKFANSVLADVIEQRKNYTESRRNNRKGTKSKNISKTYVPHMVNVNKDVNKDVNETETINELRFDEIFDSLTLDGYRVTFPNHDIDNQLQIFKLKVRGSPDKYSHRDTGSIRQAFIHQLANYKPNGIRNNTKTSDRATDAVIPANKSFGIEKGF